MEHYNIADALAEKLASKEAVIGICGLGYVGLPLAMAAVSADYKVIGFDINAPYVETLRDGSSQIGAVPDQVLGESIASGKFNPVTDFALMGKCDCLLICVPTPLSKDSGPDLQYINDTVDNIAKTLRKGQLVVLESTTYPGTTREVVKPVLEARGLKSGLDFFLGFSPEREDPGNANYSTRTIPKVVAGEGEAAQKLVVQLYSAFIKTVVPVSNTDVAEAVKLTENIFRAVNIALVNELKVIYGALGIDVWEVIEAAKTKPFGYMPFYPGPGLGGHCIPIDPFYLAWKAKQVGLSANFIELAGKVNIAMPAYVVEKLAGALMEHGQKPMEGARVLIIGLAYKKNISDIRESPTMSLIELLEKQGVNVSYHDPFVPEMPPTREHSQLTGRLSVPVTAETLQGADAVLIATDHDSVDYDLIARHANLIIDTRNRMHHSGLSSQKVIKA